MSRTKKSKLGELLREARRRKGLEFKEILNAIPTYYRYARSLRRLEAGQHKPDREHLIALIVKGLQESDPNKINEILTVAGYDGLSMKEETQYLTPAPASPVPQLVRWGPDDGKAAGIVIDGPDGLFIPWAELKPEIESRLLVQVAKVLARSAVKTAEHEGHRDFVVRIVSPGGKVIGSVWLGCDPYRDWAYDGLVRVGWSKHAGASETVVWQVFQRYSDGSYRRIRAYDAESNIAETPEPQLTIWTTGRGGEPGIFIDRRGGAFIPWSVLQGEINWLLRRVERLPLGCTVQTVSHKGIENYFVQVFGPDGVLIPDTHVWFGIDPSSNWQFDGLVRIGRSDQPGSRTAEVWDVFQRYSDGSYRRRAEKSVSITKLT